MRPFKIRFPTGGNISYVQQNIDCQPGRNCGQDSSCLQRDGYKSHQIFDALNQAETKPGAPVDNSIPQPPIQDTPAPDYPQPSPVQSPTASQPLQPNPGQAPYPYEDYSYGQPAPANREEIEEVAESIIEEKWQDFLKSVNKILEWKDSVETKITKIEHEIKTLKSDYDKLHKGVLGKISEYDKSIVNVGTEVKALGKTFEKILPTLAENVSELSRITSKVKGKKVS